MPRLWLSALVCLLASPVAHAEGGWPDLSQPTTAAIPRPNDVAVVIGIEDYDHLVDVPGATDSAIAWHRWLEQGLGMPALNLHLLVGSEATAQAMAAAVTEAALDAGPEAAFWFVFVGQASPSCDGSDVLFFQPDAGPEAPGYIQGAFTWRSLEGLLEIGSQQRNIVLIDASINQRDRSLDKLGCEMLPVMPPIDLAPSEHTVLITAAQDDELAGSLLGTELPAFSTLMLGALRGWADGSGDGQVTANEAVEWILGVLQATERLVPQSPQVHGAGGSTPLVTAALPSPDLENTLYDVARYQAQVRAESLAWSPPPPPPAPEQPPVEPDAAARASHDQLTSEMRHLGSRNAWKGVEQAFLDLEGLAPSGIVPSIEDLGLGAQAARALGKVDAVYSRLERLEALQPSLETRQWLDELVRSYGRVKLHDRPGGASLTAARMPMAPDQRTAIEAAISQVADSGRFTGRLPWGVYALGDRRFVVLPGERELEVVIRRR